MNGLVAAFVWSAFQVTLFSVIVVAIVFVVRKRIIGTMGPALSFTMGLLLVFSLLALAPLPSWLPSVTVESGQHILTSEVANELGPAVSAGNNLAKNSNPGDGIIESSATRVGATTGALSFIAEQPHLANGTFGNWLVGWILLACGTLGIIRLTIGVFSIRRLKRKSRELFDSRAVQLVNDLRAELKVEKPVPVNVTADLKTAATIGWIKPMILLPEDWAEWSDLELSSAIAHEIAHISGGDFASNLVSQFAIALNFFNPLVHWLGKELRVTQEMLADEKAATHIGSRHTYLRVMAEMAIRQEEHNLGWLAQPFLPTRTTFHRRIEMLKGEKRLHVSGSRVWVLFSQAAMLAIATFCLGFRTPMVDAAIPQEPDIETFKSRLVADENVDSRNKLNRIHNARYNTSRKAVSQLFNAVTERIVAATMIDSAERIRSIAIAMHNYHDANGHLPAASITAEGSEHPHSWRIAILPYMDGGEDIYENYKFDEPWNSEHNTNATRDMPALYRHSDQAEDATASSVYLLTGPSTLFAEGQTIKMEDLADRLATTLMVFEAKRDTHWAEPVDIEFDKDNPEIVLLMKQLLGYSSDAVIASKMDASTVPLDPDLFDAETLRSMILIEDE